MKLLALDLALTIGFAFGESFSGAFSGTWQLPGFDDKNLDRSMASAYSAVNCCCRANAITDAVVEAALMGIMKKNRRGIWTPTSRHGDRCLVMLSGAVRAGLVNAGVKTIRWPAPNTWRHDVLGNGYPPKPKEAALEYCRMMGKPVEDHNQAEAKCLLVWGLSRGPGLLERVKTP